MMRLVQVSTALTIFIIFHQTLIAASRGRSEDLSRALGELRRRRRWLEAGLPADFESLGHHYGTITHFAPEKSKRQGLPTLLKGGMPLPEHHESNDVDEENKRKKKSPAKRSFFRERNHRLEDLDRKKKRYMGRESDGDYDDTWADSESELVKDLAQRRFLDTLLGKAQQEELLQTNQVPSSRFGESSEIEDLNDEEVGALIDILRRQLANTKYYMEGEGPSKIEDDDEEDEDEEIRKRKRFLAIRKRLMWQDGFRYALGDKPDKRQDDEESIENEPWWIAFRERAYPEEMDDSEEYNHKKKREPDPWFPAFELKKRYYDAMLPKTDWKKRSSIFRERGNHLQEDEDKKKRQMDKRMPEAVERKRIVKKSVSQRPFREEDDGSVMKELKSIMEDDQSSEKRRVERKIDGDEEEAEGNENLTDEIIPDNSEDESPLADYFGYDRKQMKRKRAGWDDYIGIDKRSRDVPIHRIIHDEKKPHPENETEEDGERKEQITDDDTKTEVEEKKQKIIGEKEERSNVTTTVEPTALAAVGTEGNESTTPHSIVDHQKMLHKEKMQRYFQSLAAAMSVKKKRASDGYTQEDDYDNLDEPLAAMDQRLETIENLVLEEALNLVESNKNEDDEMNRENLREKIGHRLEAAQSLEKIREGLAEFDSSLDQIRQDQQKFEDDEEKRKKKDLVKKEESSMSEALHVMAPQTHKRRDYESEEKDDGECKIYSEIVVLCQELSRTAGDARGALVDACSRHIMCYACDYAYKDGPQIPCDLIFMREGHDICGDDVYCRSAAAQMHGILRQRAKVTQQASLPVCLSESCIRAYRRR